MKHVKISETTAARIKNLLTKMSEGEGEGADAEKQSEVKDEAEKLAKHMLDKGMILAESEEKTAELLQTPEGCMQFVRKAVDVLSAEPEEKQASDKEMPSLGRGRKDYTPKEKTSKDRMADARQQFEDTVLSANAAQGGA